MLIENKKEKEGDQEYANRLETKKTPYERTQRDKFLGGLNGKKWEKVGAGDSFAGTPPGAATQERINLRELEIEVKELGGGTRRPPERWIDEASGGGQDKTMGRGIRRKKVVSTALYSENRSLLQETPLAGATLGRKTFFQKRNRGKPVFFNWVR